MASKYLKNENGIVRAITSDNLQLEKPLLNENYDIEVHNRNMDKIDGAIIDDRSNISNLQSSIASLQTKINNGQNYKLTQDNGSSKFVDRGTFDDIKTTGIYTCSSNVGGAKPNPSYDGYYHLEVIGADSHLGENNKWITQRATIFEGTGHGIQVYTRICQNGDWTHWGRNAIDGQNVKLTDDAGCCIMIPNNNADDIVKTGFYMGENVTNAPSVTYNWVYIESKVHNNLYQIQIATDLHNSKKRWTRHKTNGTWSDWRSL